MRKPLYESHHIVDLNDTGSMAPALSESKIGWDLSEFTKFSIQLSYITAPSSPGTWLGILEWSVDGNTWTAFSASYLLSNTNPYRLEVPIEGYKFVRFRVQTAQGAECKATLAILATRNID